MNTAKNWLRIGVVGRPHGLHGAFLVQARAEPIATHIKWVRIGPDPESAPSLRLLNLQQSSATPVMRCESFDSRSAIESQRGQPIWVERQQLQLDEDQECLWQDLIGKPIHDLEDRHMGVIAEVYNCGASDIAVVEHQDETLEIPLVPTYFQMDFTAASPFLKLTVAAETFQELWGKKS